MSLIKSGFKFEKKKTILRYFYMPKQGPKKEFFTLLATNITEASYVFAEWTQKNAGEHGVLPEDLLGSGTPYKYIWGFKWVYINRIITINLIKIDLNTAKIIAVQD